jgi:AraC family transcriptional regulator of arabinose operon
MKRTRNTISQLLKFDSARKPNPKSFPVKEGGAGAGGRRQTPHFDYPEIVTGHFFEKAGYNAYRERGTDDFLLIYTVSGRGRFGYRTGEQLAYPGDLALLRPGAFHDYGVEPQLQRWELLWAHFLPRAHWHPWLNWPEFAPGAMAITINDPAARSQVLARMKAMHRHASGPLRSRGDFALNALEEVLLLAETQNPLRRSRLDSRMQAVVDFICRNLSEKISLDNLAEVSGLSLSRMAHLFRDQVGSTPQRFLEQQRLDRAMQLLAYTPHSVKTIAYELGFDNPFYFTLRFKRHTGISPREYRKRLGGPDTKYRGRASDFNPREDIHR